MAGREFTPSAVLENSAEIRRSAEEVFDYASDLRNELEWNPDCRVVELVTPAPIATGSRFLIEWARSGPMDVEMLLVQRPRRWSASATSKRLEVRFHGRVAPERDIAKLHVTMELMPVGRTKLVFPLLRLLFARGERRNMRLIKEALEGSTPLAPVATG